MNNKITIIVGIIFLIINIVLIIYIIKAGKYSELTYRLLKAEFKKQEERERDRKTNDKGEERDRKTNDKGEPTKFGDVQDVWREIQNEK